MRDTRNERRPWAAVGKLKPDIPSTLVMRELPEPRPTHVLLGGDFLQKGIQVWPGTPAVLPPLPEREKYTRLDLGHWLVDEQNPLTPRVTVNRIWQRYFGTGIVETSNDFGTQGTPPSHARLLDWLASEFLAQDWSLKAIHRLIATSATYRQSSRHRPDLRPEDPRNRLLARQNRLRVESEVIRDLALSASGLLAPKIGGPSVYPPQPPWVIIKNGARPDGSHERWPESQGQDRYRRGLYTYYWRLSPHPALAVFDSPDAMLTVIRRNRSTTPLQALTLLNDEGFHEFAQGLAYRVLRELPDGTDCGTARSSLQNLSDPAAPAPGESPAGTPADHAAPGVRCRSGGDGGDSEPGLAGRKEGPGGGGLVHGCQRAAQRRRVFHPGMTDPRRGDFPVPPLHLHPGMTDRAPRGTPGWK